jgi:hypothetical protein
MTESTAAYLAGIIDGEGCITISRHKPKSEKGDYTYTPCVVVAMTSEDVILYLHKNIKNGWYTKPKVIGNGRQQYRFVVSGRHAMDFVEEIKPYLVEKTEQAELFLKMKPAFVMRSWSKSAEGKNIKEQVFQGLKDLHL